MPTWKKMYKPMINWVIQSWRKSVFFSRRVSSETFFQLCSSRGEKWSWVSLKYLNGNMPVKLIVIRFFSMGNTCCTCYVKCSKRGTSYWILTKTFNSISKLNQRRVPKQFIQFLSPLNVPTLLGLHYFRSTDYELGVIKQHFPTCW